MDGVDLVALLEVVNELYEGTASAAALEHFNLVHTQLTHGVIEWRTRGLLDHEQLFCDPVLCNPPHTHLVVRQVFLKHVLLEALLEFLGFQQKVGAGEHLLVGHEVEFAVALMVS